MIYEVLTFCDDSVSRHISVSLLVPLFSLVGNCIKPIPVP